MANTYTQIHIQAILVVKYRESLIRDDWREELYKYMTGIIQNHGHKVLQINGMPDHVHILFGMRPTQSLSELMQQVKGDSSEWINKTEKSKKRFHWQPGYGAFSYAKYDVPRVIKYIQNQQTHHQKSSFKEEYIALLKTHQIEYDERYLFDFFD